MNLGEQPAASLVAAWRAVWSADPTRAVLQAPYESLTWSADAFESLTAEVAERLIARGIGPGARVLFSAAPSSGLVATYVAALRCGAAVVPANTAYVRAELEHICRAARVDLAVTDEPERFRDLVTAVTPVELMLGPRTGGPLDQAGPDDVAMVAFTSGTTGRPKAAVHLHRTLLAGARSVVTAWEWAPDDQLLLCLPLFHMHGLGVGVHGSLTAGGTMLLLPRFDPQAVRAAAAVTSMFFGVPTMYARLGDALEGLSGQRLLVSGSAPLDPVHFEQIRNTCGQSPLERYGMTETVMITGNPLRGERRAGSVGLPLPGVDVQLDESTSEVLVRSPAVFAGYDSDGSMTPPAEWFATGDIGARDTDGYLRLVGRASELIITGGYNVYPREVEDALREHPGVADVAVVGLPDPTWGEVIAAAVEGSADVADLSAHLRDRVATYKQPRTWLQVAQLPRNQMGKVQRAMVRELFR
jgi:malonyl-CoA/methylmalonyl-CoA synthetase